MNHFGITPAETQLLNNDLAHARNVFWNLSPAELVEETIALELGVLSNKGALAIDTGKFTGRSPKDRFIVKDDKTKDEVWWGDINIPFEADKFDKLYQRMMAYLTNRDIYVRDAYAGAEDKYRLKLRVITELPWSNLFAYNMFLRPKREELENFSPEWHIVCAPEFKADPEVDGTRQDNFAIINFTKKMILIGGTAYTGEIKKGIFSVMNFILPVEHGVLPMHCSANVGQKKDTAIFFGLSGTGKTTLSSDPNRMLIGDDEHGWSDNTVFNFEGGCYAKCIGLTEEQEPQIYNAIKFEALLENIRFEPGTSKPDYNNSEVTENTRVSYPLYHIDNSLEPSVGDIPKNIFFLTCDAFGVLPPISKLSKPQAMYHFMSGYTAKVAGTEEGITEPQTAFSACFGAPFMPLHPARYAEMLGEKIEKNDVNVWLVNTGWTGGSYGEGSRIKLKYTRAMITAALNGELDNVEFKEHPVFGIHMVMSCPGVPDEILNPENLWTDKTKYRETTQKLAERFNNNFKKFEAGASAEIIAANPKVGVASE